MQSADIMSLLYELKEKPDRKLTFVLNSGVELNIYPDDYVSRVYEGILVTRLHKSEFVCKFIVNIDNIEYVCLKRD